MREDLNEVLSQTVRPAIAVSGGVDSVTLAAVAAELLEDVLLVHATSPAVPAEATERIQGLAARRGWQLRVVRAGEFDDPKYLQNPSNRCFHCKNNLYGTIGTITERPILSGANLDDLAEYRPGLVAAREHRVRHPYIEAGIDKRGVRKLAHFMGLHEVAELPASPCLSSRVETGIRIEPSMLDFIHRVERLVAAAISPATVRCRVRAAAVVIELDAPSLSRLSTEVALMLNDSILKQPHRPQLPVLFDTYRNGSAFLGQGARR